MPKPLSHRGPDELYERVLAGVPRESSLVFGIELDDDGFDLHLRPLIPDERGAAGSLLGFEAPPCWAACGAVLTGRARRIDTDGGTTSGPLAEASTAMLVDRCGRLLTDLHMDGEPLPGPTSDLDGQPIHPIVQAAIGPHGTVIDALHRALGLGCPGEPPPVVFLWLVLQASVLHRKLGDNTFRTQDASPKAVLGWIERMGTDHGWADVRPIAERGHWPTTLTSLQIDWMDDTMLGRWLITEQVSPFRVLDELNHRHPRAAKDFELAIEAVVDLASQRRSVGELRSTQP